MAETISERTNSLKTQVAFLKERREALTESGPIGALKQDVQLVHYVGTPNVKDGIAKTVVPTRLWPSVELPSARYIELSTPVDGARFVLYWHAATKQSGYGLLMEHPHVKGQLCIALSEEQLVAYLHPQGEAFSYDEKTMASSTLVAIMYTLVNHASRVSTL